MGAPKLGTVAERDAIQAKMEALSKEGLSYEQIGEKFGVNPGTVGYYLNVRGKGKGKRGPYKKKPKKHVTLLERARNGHVVSVLGGPTDKSEGSEATGFAAGFISGWLGSYAVRHGLDATGLTLDVVSILRKEVR